jgi:hypothetical protein
MNLNTEANIQAEFYHACRLIDLPVALEIRTPAGRVDCMVLDKDRTMVLAIVEVKDSPNAFLSGNMLQIQRYKTLGVPVYGLCPRNCAHRLAATIKRKHQFPNGVFISVFAGQKSYVREFRRKKREELLAGVPQPVLRMKPADPTPKRKLRLPQSYH